MQPCYFDNAATAFPKAPNIGKAMGLAVEELGVNPNRSSSEQATQAGLAMLELRENLCTLLGGTDPACCIFTAGATFGLNMVLQGWCRPQDHVLITSMEHNAVLRPLKRLEDRGVQLEILPCAADGTLDPSVVEQHLRSNTRLVFMTHASNVTGTLLPVYAVGEICRRRGIPFGVDAAQTAGHIPLSMEEMGAQVLVVPAHKGLLGPGGIGAVLMCEEFAQALPPLCVGGTGSASELLYQPTQLPDKFEAGTCNLAGIYGWKCAAEFLCDTTVEAVQQQEQRLREAFTAGLEGMADVRTVGRADLGVVSLDFLHMDNGGVGYALEREYQIYTRCGLQCAPLSHQTLGTYPAGTVRFSFGLFNTMEQVEYALECIKNITKRPTIL